MTKAEVIDVLRALELEFMSMKNDLKTNRKRLFFVEYYKKKLQKDVQECKANLGKSQEAVAQLKRSTTEQAAVIVRLSGQSRAGKDLMSTIQRGFETLSDI